ncbi:hypothetical protein Nmel_010598, partial [Mimus melanotis]
SKYKTNLRKPRGNFVYTALLGGRRSSHPTLWSQQRSKLAATCSCELLSLLLALAAAFTGSHCSSMICTISGNLQRIRQKTSMKILHAKPSPRGSSAH